MSSEESQPAGQNMDLEDSIDALLDEIDTACASVENPEQGKPTPKRLDRPAEAINPDEVLAETQQTESVAGDEPSGTAELDEAQDTIEALDAVEQNAQSLIEDAIGDLLGDDEPHTSSDHDDDEPADESAIDAELDALDSKTEPETEPESLTEDAAEPEPISETGAGTASDGVADETQPAEIGTASEDDLPDADELLDEIAQELTEASAPTPAPDTKPDAQAEIEPEQQPDQNATAATEPEPEPHTQEGTGESALSQATDVQPDESDSDEDASVPDLADLDATLASIDDDDLLGDFETPDGELVSADSIRDSDATALLEQLGLGDLSFEHGNAASQPEPAAEHPSEPRPDTGSVLPKKESPKDDANQGVQSEAQPSVQAAAQPSATTAPTNQAAKPQTVAPSHEPEPEPEPEPDVRSIWESLWVRASHYGTVAWAHTKSHGIPLGARVVLLVNKPIRRQPAQLRDSIGYLALWTVLMALILWVFLAFVRDTPTPTPTQAPSRVLEPGEIADPLRARGTRP